MSIASEHQEEAEPGENKAQRVYRVLRDSIMAGEFSPGYRLVLSRLAEEFRVSPVPVREAVRRLEAQGLVLHTRNVGFEVTGVDPLNYAGAMETLAILEGAATALSATNLSAEQLDEARELNVRMRGISVDTDPVRVTELNSRFHQALYGACPNTHLLELLDREWAHLGRIRRSTFSYIPERAADSVDEHDHLIRLIADGAEPHEIEMATRHHTLRTMRLFMERKPLER